MKRLILCAVLLAGCANPKPAPEATYPPWSPGPTWTSVPSMDEQIAADAEHDIEVATRCLNDRLAADDAENMVWYYKGIVVGGDIHHYGAEAKWEKAADEFRKSLAVLKACNR